MTIDTSWWTYEYSWDNVKEMFFLMMLCTIPNLLVIFLMSRIRKLFFWILQKIKENFSPDALALAADAFMGITAIVLMIIYNHKTFSDDDIALYAFGIQLPVLEILVILFYVIRDTVRYLRQKLRRTEE